MKFKELFEAKTERAIFSHHGNINIGDMWDLIEDPKQTFVTVDDIPFYDGDSAKEYMLHFVGTAKSPKDWDKFVKYIETKCNKCTFERLVP